MYDRCRKALWVLLSCASGMLIIYPALVNKNHSDPVFYGKNRMFKMPAPVISHGTVSINEGDANDLTELYGIGETLAELIIEEREVNGPFYYPEDLTSVKGIGMGKLSRIRDDLDY